MTKKIMFEVYAEGKKELNECLKKLGYLNKHVEFIGVHCNDGEVSKVKPLMNFK